MSFREAALENLILEFLEILDNIEETDNGRLFRPTYISSCRVIESEKIRKILKQMREQTNFIPKDLEKLRSEYEP